LSSVFIENVNDAEQMHADMSVEEQRSILALTYAYIILRGFGVDLVMALIVRKAFSTVLALSLETELPRSRILKNCNHRRTL
jgi:hypothetical protein